MLVKNFFSTLLLSLAAFALPAFAGEPAYELNKVHGDYSITGVICRDSSTVLLCTYCVPQDDAALPAKMSIGRRTRVETGDGEYKLIGTSHFPIWDEADSRYAFLSEAGSKLNFILEFEKFPVDETFDIVEDKSNDGNDFTVRGIVVDTAAVGQLDAEAFLSRTPYTEYGCFMEDGDPIQYYEHDGMRVEFGPGENYELYSSYLQAVGFKVINNTGKTLEIHPSSVSVCVWKTAKSKPKNVDLLTMEECDKAWKELDEREVMYKMEKNAGEMVGGRLVDLSLSPGTSFGASIGMLALGVALNKASKPDLEPYMTELNAEREEAMKSYIKDAAIASGDDLSFFAGFTHGAKTAYSQTVITIDGVSYRFEF